MYKVIVSVVDENNKEIYQYESDIKITDMKPVKINDKFYTKIENEYTKILMYDVITSSLT